MSSYSWFHFRPCFVRLDLGYNSDNGHVTKDLLRALKATNFSSVGLAWGLEICVIYACGHSIAAIQVANDDVLPPFSLL